MQSCAAVSLVGFKFWGLALFGLRSRVQVSGFGEVWCLCLRGWRVAAGLGLGGSRVEGTGCVLGQDVLKKLLDYKKNPKP